MELCKNCIFKAPVVHTRGCLAYNNVEQCPMHNEEKMPGGLITEIKDMVIPFSFDDFMKPLKGGR